LRHLRNARPNADSRGIDFSNEAVAMTRAGGDPADVVDVAQDDIEGSYDFVTCFEVIEHIANAEDALRRIMGATKVRAIVSIPNVGYIMCRLRLALFGRFPITNCVLHVNEHVRFWTPIDFHEWVVRQGYRVVEQRGHMGLKPLWRRFPTLWASGIVYVIEH